MSTATKSVTITNELRRQIADQLMAQAVTKQGQKIGAKLEKLNAKFWEAHLKQVDAVLGIERSRWPELMQAGVLCSTFSVEPHWFKDRGEGMSPASVRAIYIGVDDSGSEKSRTVGLIKQASALSKIKTHIVSASYNRAFALRFVSPSGSVPRLNGMEVLPDGALLKESKVIEAELEELISAAMKFRREVMGVLMTCRTSRQLEDLLPEAAKLLPEPAPKRTAVVPVEQAKAISAMLKTGVPPARSAEVAL